MFFHVFLSFYRFSLIFPDFRWIRGRGGPGGLPAKIPGGETGELRGTPGNSGELQGAQHLSGAKSDILHGKPWKKRRITLLAR